MIVVAIDIGGTFTDLIGFDDRAKRFVQAKSLTTPRNLVQGIIDCIDKSGLDAGRDRRTDPRLDHRHQHADRAQGRQDRADRHRAAPATSTSSAAATGRKPTICSSTATGRWCRAVCTWRSASACSPPARSHAELDRASVDAACQRARRRRASRPSRCASCTPTPIPSTSAPPARSIRAALPDAYLSLSHEILREYREFERTSTTVVNAYIGPKVGGYVQQPEVQPRRDRLQAATSRSCAPTAA